MPQRDFWDDIETFMGVMSPMVAEPVAGLGGMLTDKSKDATGVYTPASTGVTEFNPMQVAKPLVARDVSNKKVALPEADRQILDSAEALRAYLDVQNAGAWHTTLPGAAVDAQRGLSMDMGDAPGKNTVAELQDIAADTGFFASDTGEGVNFIPDVFSPKGKDRGGVDLGKELRSGLSKRLQDVSGVKPERTAMESGFLDYEDAWAGGGKGKATSRLFDTLDKNPSIREALDTPAMRQKAGANLRRDTEYSEKLGLPIREDIQHGRKILEEGGIEALKKELLANPDLLASLMQELGNGYA